EVPLDLQIVRGIWIEGQLTDADTGKPLRGGVDYMYFRDNPHAPPQLGLDAAYQLHRFSTENDGHFRVAGLPGKGVVGATSYDRQPYPRSVGIESIDGYDGNEYIANLSHFAPLSNWNLLRQIEVSDTAETFQCDMALSRGTVVPGRAIGPDGLAVRNLKVVGVVPNDEFWIDATDSQFEISTYDPEQPRDLFFKSSDNQLIGHVRLEGPAPQEIVATLQPAVTVTGRLIAQETDEPAVDYSIHCSSTSRGKFRFEEQLHTDNDGRFTIPGLLAGLKYQTSTANPQHFSSGKNDFVIDLTIAKPGDTVELGDVRGQDKKAMQAAMMQSAAESAIPVGDKEPDETDTAFEYRGTVVDEAGQPIEGAKISLNYWRKSAESLGEPLAVTGRDGAFRFTRKPSDFADGGDDRVWSYATLVAMKEGHGLAARTALAFETTGGLEAKLPERSRQYIAEKKKSWSNKLTLPTDLPVRGRLLNTEGLPVAGATIEPINIWEGKNGSLDEWLAETKRPQANYYSARNHLSQLVHGNFIDGPHWSAIAPVTTDADGWFTLAGLGHERIAQVIISGPGIESSKTYLRSRPGEIVKLSKSERGDNPGDDTYYPAEFTHVSGPSQAVIGRVTDSESGEPIAGVRVRSDRLAGQPVAGILAADYVRTVTDANGRYRLEGLPLGENKFVALPAKGTPYLVGEVSVTTSAGQPELVRDIRLTKGVLVRGRAIDGTTGTPLRGEVQAFIFNNNPQLKSLPTRLGGDSRDMYRADADGRFEIPVLPGPGILTFMAEDHEMFPRGAGADKIEGPRQMSGSDVFFTQPIACIPDSFHALAAVNFEPGEDVQTVDFTLGSGASIAGRIVDANGQPLTDCYLFGENAFASWYQHQPAEFSVEGYFPRAGRRLIAWNPAMNVVGELFLTGEAPAGPVELKLDQQAGKLRGRLLDDDGEPIVGATLGPRMSDSLTKVDNNRTLVSHPEHARFIDQIEGRPVATDTEGRFELVGLLPGKLYSSSALGLVKVGGQSLPSILGTVFKDVTVDAGETKELGDVRLQPRRPNNSTDTTSTKPPASGSATSFSRGKTAGQAATTTAMSPQSQPAVSDAKPVTDSRDKFGEVYRFAGSIIDARQQAVEGVEVRFTYHQRQPLLEAPAVRAMTDAQGRFEFTINSTELTDATSPESINFADIVATKVGYGFQTEWAGAFETAGKIDASLTDQQREYRRDQYEPGRRVITLPDDLPIRGRLLDAEGQPVANASVEVTDVWRAGVGSVAEIETEPTQLDELISGFRIDRGYNVPTWIVPAVR
ncbi:MAG: carboxypeptidase regulatory-like domain-containing protein, partial [Planctomycetaceae bacterium]